MPKTLLRAALLCGLALGFHSCDTPPVENPDALAADCYENPQTHLEIINSCAAVDSYDKPPQLQKFAPGAPLMPLP